MALTKIGLRQAWFQVHKWIGLLLAILIIPLCLSGSALVWHDALDAGLNPQRYAMTSETPRRPPQAYVAAAAAVLAPGERISNLRFAPGEPVTIAAVQAPRGAAEARPGRSVIWLDPGSARVLDKADGQAGFVRFVHQLHGSLLVPGLGRQIVGWLGVAMLLSSLSGLWLWWPTAGSWTRGLRWRRHRNLDTNLHHQFGFWIALPLFMLSLTGAWISFPAFFARLGGESGQQRQGGEARSRARPLEAPAQTPEAVLAAAHGLASGEVTSLAWPTDQKAEWAVTLKPAQGRPVSVVVDDAAGRARVDRKAFGGAGGLARTMRQLHDGTDMGAVWQVIIFLGGLLPAALAVTGVIMWWRARGWRGEIEERRARVSAPAE
ncbi:MAG: PepSY domain-containing protein [Sphingomonadales bacterium]|nr:PepSY domain-containing protein [Sphingomonadales bacterium]